MSTLAEGNLSIAAQFSTRMKTILVVGDEEVVRMFLAAALQHRGYRTISAKSGADGLRRFSGHQSEIDLVISDILMPDVGGYQMVKAIRAIRQNVPVLFITGTMQDLPTWVIESCDVLRRPFGLDNFQTAVDEMTSADYVGLKKGRMISDLVPEAGGLE